MERLLSEISETCLNDLYVLSWFLLLTHFLIKLPVFKLIIFLIDISKGSKDSEYSIVFGAMAKFNPSRLIFLWQFKF